MRVTTTKAGAPSKRRPYAARVPAEQRREQILDAAIAIIVRDGYDAISVDAIAREVGVTRPVIYGVFDGLKELLDALLDRQQARALAQLQAALADPFDPTDFDDSVRRLMRRLIALPLEDPVTWRPILYAGVGTPELVRARIDGDREEFVSQVRDLLELAAAMKGLRKVDTEVAAHAVVALLEYFGRLLLEDPPRFEADRLGQAVAGLVVLFG